MWHETFLRPRGSNILGLLTNILAQVITVMPPVQAKFSDHFSTAPT